MRRAWLGYLVFVALLAGSNAFAAEPGSSPGTENGNQPAKTQSAKTQTAKTEPAKAKPKKPAPASLSAAEQATTRTVDLPAAPAHDSTPPAGRSWTGFHVGVEGG